MAKFKKNINDVIEEKEAKLVALSQQSVDAVSLMRTTLDILQGIDDDIVYTISEIDDMQARMSNTKAGLESRRMKNQQMMRNFKSLLCEE